MLTSENLAMICQNIVRLSPAQLVLLQHLLAPTLSHTAIVRLLNTSKDYLDLHNAHHSKKITTLFDHGEVRQRASTIYKTLFEDVVFPEHITQNKREILFVPNPVIAEVLTDTLIQQNIDLQKYVKI
jgi:hypothetical protein